MAETYEINDLLEYWPNPETPCWMVEATRASDGQKYRHIFPKATLAYRAAEYGIDPADTDTLIDMILHEPFAASPDDPITAPADPALAAGLTAKAVVARGTVNIGDQTTVTLFNADSIDQARQAHMLRIEDAKAKVATMVVPKNRKALLAALRAEPIDRDFVTRHRAAVDARRAAYKGTPPAPGDSVVLDNTRESRRA
jgi:hypothetical protein